MTYNRNVYRLDIFLTLLGTCDRNLRYKTALLCSVALRRGFLVSEASKQGSKTIFSPEEAESKPCHTVKSEPSQLIATN